MIGRIEKVARHPHADRLMICSVDIGRGSAVQEVTSAENVREGAFVPVALPGSVVPALHGAPHKDGGYEISEGSMRGIECDGMLCGPQELGLEDKVAPYISKDGIWLLPGDWSEHLGEDITEALGLKDFVIDFEITPNRPDCLSMLGMAREAAATFGKVMKYPDISVEGADESAEDYISVEVRSGLCKRFTAHVIKDVKIEQSPWWIQKRLIAAGMRPINNIVDLTNFVMLEYGQPLHAYDIETLAGHKIIVDTANDGDTFTTLDGTVRTLDCDMLMINDAVRPVGLAGIMGGLDSEITESTTTVVLEAASFLGSNIRLTAKRLGMRTEASGRFEKGIDPNNCEAAADRFCHLVRELGAGTVLNGSVDIYNNPEEAPVVTARVSRINKVLGTDISRDEMKRYLEGLEMKVEGDGDELIVTPPSVRQDLLEEVDYVEEIARMYGYDNLPMTLPAIASRPSFSKSWTLRALTRDLLSGMGYTEVQTYSFSNQKILDRAGIPEDTIERDLIRITNPMGEDTEFMRTVLSPGMLEVLGTNYAKRNAEVRAYEIGITFRKNVIETELPKEQFSLCLGTYGGEEDFFTLKGVISELLDRLGVKSVRFEAEKEYGLFHPGRCARICVRKENGEDTEIGIMGEVHPEVQENFGIGERTYIAELFFNIITEISDRTVQYKKPPVFPSTSRDVAMIVREDTEVQKIEDAILDMAPELLAEVRLFDVYRGLPVPPGKKSVAYSFTYRSDERTLTDAEADEVHARILDMLREKFDADIREN